MLALWALFLLSALIISWALDIDSRLVVSGNANRALEAEALACSGAEVGSHWNTKVDSPNLHRNLKGHGNYDVRITGEGGRLNLNWLLQGEDPVGIEILRKYLENKHIDLNERDYMIDSLLDWVEPDTGLHHLNGAAESEDYHPAHTPLTRIDELKKVKGWEQFASQPGWDDDFTLNSNGPIDPNWASRGVLLALPGMTEEWVDRFLKLRAGPDGIEGTSDDLKFQTDVELQAAFGFSRDQFQTLTRGDRKTSLFGFKDPTLRVVSVGQSGNVTRTVQVIVRKPGNASVLVMWKEF